MTIRLHPRGAVVAALGEAHRSDDVFRRLGVGARRCDLGDESLYLAEELVDADEWITDPTSRQALGALILALMVAQRQGSTRLPLDPTGPLRKLLEEILALAHGEGETQRGAPKRALDKYLRCIADLTGGHFSSIIGLGHARMPLVVDDGALYSERLLWLEERVAKGLRARLREPRNLDAGEHALAATLAEGGPAVASLTDEQRQAVVTALASPLAVITGGPGTGKTAVAAAVVRGLIALGARSIALTAPTGKAAQRLGEVIAKQLGLFEGEALGAPHSARTVTTTFALGQTVHRLLGLGEEGVRHHARSPLAVDAVIVDEASMLDLELMESLLDALPPRARLILIGDARQLPAVDAGQILADLVAQGDGVAQLTKSFRMDKSDPRGAAVLEAAEAINTGDPKKVISGAGRIATVRKDAASLTFEGVEWLESKGRVEDARAVAEALWHRILDRETVALADVTYRFVDGEIVPDQAPLLEALWERLSQKRLLTVTRGQPTGSLAINRTLHELMLARLSVGGRPDWVPGEPIMITANDYQRGLFNGDQGIVARVEEPHAGHRYRALFRVGGRLVPFSLEAIRDRLELSWAMTVHKSQGSEMNACALILPLEDLPILTRELIYTGLTRARHGAAIVGAKQIFLSGCARFGQRHTGLLRRLAASGEER